MKAGIVGLPNVGKSTLFNCLSNAKAQSANFPFCTIEPNLGVVNVPDARLEKLEELVNPERVQPATVEIVDIAGLVKGASKGEGLGNQFLGNIRECNAIIHVLRCFDNDNIVHVDGNVNPIRDKETIDIELQLKDLETIEKRLDKVTRAAKSGDKLAQKELELLKRFQQALLQGISARAVEVNEEESELIKGFQLLTAKPILYVCNVDETSAVSGNKYVDMVKEAVKTENAEVIVLAVATEADIAEAGVTSIALRGAHLGSDSDINHTNLVQKIILGESDDSIRATLKETMVQNMLNKDTVQAIVDSEGVEIFPADTRLTEEGIEAILNSDVKEVQVRNNEIHGIEVEAIVEGTGVIEPLKDRIVGRIAAEELVNKETGEVIVPLNGEITEALADEVVKHYETVKIRSVLTCRSPYGVCRKCYGRDLGTGNQVQVGEAVGIIAAQSIGEPGTQLTMRTFHTGGVAGDDITQGLPRVEELFEARKPKRNAIIAENEGTVRVVPNEGKKGTNTIFITGEDGIELDYLIPYGSRIIVKDGDVVSLGARLTEGSINPHDIMRVMGTEATQRYLVYEVQKVYKSQGVEINDKHIEVIVRQMLHKVKIETAGDADMLPGDMVDVNTFDEENRRLTLNGRENATGKRTLLGITKAALATDSFLSAASFQETTRVLTDAAIKGKIDPLLGLKENVIIGKLIPAGTGMSRYRKIEVVKNTPEIIDITEEVMSED